jgi:signal transduction histidine kinase
MTGTRKPIDGPDGDAAIVEDEPSPSVDQVAHDLNNILTSVLGYAEIVAEDAREAKVDVRDAQQLLLATREAVALVKVLRASARRPAPGHPRTSAPSDRRRGT